jgi:hypothetical protein
MFLLHEEAEEIMISWEPGSVITDAVIWSDKYLDKVARRITVASTTVIQRCWQSYKVALAQEEKKQESKGALLLE